jgi:hypothetical protein
MKIGGLVDKRISMTDAITACQWRLKPALPVRAANRYACDICGCVFLVGQRPILFSRPGFVHCACARCAAHALSLRGGITP